MHNLTDSDLTRPHAQPIAGPDQKRLCDRKQTYLQKILFAPPEDSAEWIESAARDGLAEAQLLLGQMLLDGIGMRRDQQAAFAWFSVAARAGHEPAITMVSQCIQNE
jgi:TPR repeat protein